jgi:lipopolysaccharide biosynthesis glycosyltransferase
MGQEGEKRMGKGGNRTVLECRFTSALDSGSEIGSHPIVLACDEAYAMPLATAVRSMVEVNRSARPLEIVVLTSEFSDNKKRKVEASVSDSEASFRWVKMDLSSFERCSTLSYISRMTYARLLLPYVFDTSIVKVLYLDADIIVLDDLRPLWDTNLDGAVLGAVVDIDSERHAERLGLTYRTTDKAATESVTPSGGYFNAGVLLVDLARWRQERISESAIQYLAQHPDTPFSDQDAINVVCAGRWQQLDVRWNLQKLDHGQYPGRLACERASVIHFIGTHKPWKASSLNASEVFYDAYRSRTKFARTHLERACDVFQRLFERAKIMLKHFEVICVIHGYYKRLKTAGTSN